jgi:outer membrane protein assembly factor BamB
MTFPNLFRPALFGASALAFLSLPLRAVETEWPQFRGPTGQGTSAATNVPVKWSATENVAWSVEIPGKGWSSPVLSKGRIYLTTAVGEPPNGVSLRALCLDAANGRTVWDTELFRPDNASASSMHRKNSLASPTPIVADGKLYAHFGHMGTAALDLNGKVLWRQDKLKYQPVHGAGGSPILTDGLLVFNCDAARDPFVAALDAGTGSVRWKTPRNTTAKKPFSFATPLAIPLGGKTQIVSPGSGLVGGYDAKDGHELWRVRYGEGYSVIPRPVFAHGLLYLSSSFDQPVLYAIRPEGAAGDATDKAVAWSIKKQAPHSASAIVVGDEVYFVSDGGIATCADAKTGAVHWSQRLGGDFSASPVAAEGRVYFQNETGSDTVLKAGGTFEVLSKNEVGEATLASLAVCDGAIFLRGAKHLWRIGKP